jgi:hypothetical protein
MAMHAGYMPIGATGKHPRTFEPSDFYMEVSTYERIKKSPKWRFEDLPLVAEVLDEPTVIFEDLKRARLSEGYCYSRRLGHSPQEGVLLVFVKDPDAEAGFTGPVVFDYAWRKEDPEMDGYPIHWRRDFGGTVWPQQS